MPSMAFKADRAGHLGRLGGPGDAGYDINTVMTTPATMESIIAVRVALVVRGEYYDKNPVSPATLTIFGGYVNAGEPRWRRISTSTRRSSTTGTGSSNSRFPAQHVVAGGGLMSRGIPVRPSRERGVVLIFTLIILLILTIGAVALLRSMNTSLFSAGNLAFRRDLTNQGEQRWPTCSLSFKAAALCRLGRDQRECSCAQLLGRHAAHQRRGVPTALLNSTAFAAVGVSANDIVGRPKR